MPHTLTHAKAGDTVRKSHTGEIQVEGIQRESFLKRSLRRAGEALGVLAVGGLPFYACTPPPHHMTPQIVFDEQRIPGQIVRDSSVARDTGAMYGSSDSGLSDDHLVPYGSKNLMPDNSIYFKEPTNFVTFKFSDTGATFLIAENQLVVSFRDEASDKNISDVQQWLAGQGASKIGEIVGLKMMQYEISSGIDLNMMLSHLKEQPGVLTALPNFVIHSALSPNPNPVGTVYDGYWWIDRIRLKEAWDITTGSADIPVAIVDEGVALNCGSFDGKNVRLGLRCKKSDGAYYYLDQINSTNECEAPLPGDHGTAVASILASRGDKGHGAIGVAWANPLISINLWGRDGVHNTYQANAAIECAIDMGARIVNLSSAPVHTDTTGKELKGQPATLEETTTFRSNLINAMVRAHRKNVLVVLAAGNTGFKNDDEWLPPADSSYAVYFKSNALIVGATDDLDDPLCNQNWSQSDVFCSSLIRVAKRCACPECMDIFGSYPMTVEGKVVEVSAPGYNVAAADAEKTNASTALFSATSIAAPMVAGAAALVLSMHPDYTAEQVKQILLTSARPYGCRQIGHGILDVAAALGVANAPWSSIYGDFDSFNSIRRTKDGGYILSTGSGRIVKTTSKGSVLWSHNTNEGDHFTIGVDALELADGANVLIGAAMPLSTPVTIEKIFIAKVDSNGGPLWIKLTGRTTQDWPSAVQETNNGNLIIAGQTAMQNMYLQKTDSLGNKIWESILDVGNIYSIEPNSSGFFLSGYLGDLSNPTAVVIKTNLDGAVLWKKTFIGHSPKIHLSKVKEGGVVAATSYNAGEIINLSDDGTVRWAVTCGGSKDFFNRVVQTRDEGFIAIGDKSLSFPTNADVWLVRLDKTGKVEWEKTFGTDGCNDGNAVLETPDGGFILAGNINSTVQATGVAAKLGKAWLIKTDKNGNTEYSVGYRGMVRW